ncbi:MAG TPA: efflux RND transporter periplasmic adaptor subunit [Steroidobacteraceae bacterium]|nr:efflux RND transporter periplasmic adaptor subunit [Steroidobacteraceae bacterium]
MKRALPVACAAALGGALVAALAACGRGGSVPAPTPPAVTVAHPQLLPFRDYLEVPGNTVASRTVNLVARVQGYLRKVYFRDGSLVTAGEPLFLIEPDAYQATVQLNEAQLRQAQAEFERQQRLIEANATSKSSVENWQSQRDAAAANTQLAQLNLSYTHISAPFAGRIGRRQVDEGNLVGNGGATQLATLEQLKPMYVYFNVNERDLLRIRQQLAERHMTRLPDVVPVEVGLQTDRDYPYQGTLDFVDTGVSTSSGTLQVRASFPNDDGRLLPGLFVKVRVATGPPQPTLAVPDVAVGHDQAGAYVLLVDAQSMVSQRHVQIGGLLNGMRAITQGLAAADRVVVDGLLNAAPGNRVTVLEHAQPAASR